MSGLPGEGGGEVEEEGGGARGGWWRAETFPVAGAGRFSDPDGKRAILPPK